jgi:hypothetical protein
MLRRIIRRWLQIQPVQAPTVHTCNMSITEIEDNKMLLGRVLSTLNEKRTEEIIEDIQKAEFKVFSQFGDDGIIQFLVNFLDIQNKTFVEFGVENYMESNTLVIYL